MIRLTPFCWVRASLLVASLGAANLASADAIRQTKGEFFDAFRQLGPDLPTANVYRTASGAPGPQYWQQRADYDIKVSLDEANRRVSASQTITYTNRSPDTLPYLWLQLDQNRFTTDSLYQRSLTAPDSQYFPNSPTPDILTYGRMAQHQSLVDGNHGYQIARILNARGQPMRYSIVDTMLRLDLDAPLKPGQKISFSMDWSFNIVERDRMFSRGGYEHFTDSNTYIYFLAQWFPRLAAYTDYAGWQHFAFLGRGEFTLEFGDYRVAITVPADHIVSATGELQNSERVLSSAQRKRLKQAKTARSPVFVVTPEEAKANEAEASDGTKTWVFEAENIRDFAFASSRKFIWDAMGFKQNDRRRPEVMAMSFYPNEAEPIWSKYSTEAVVHTMEVYSRFAFPYPYPTAQSINTWKAGGMEYPMVTFNGYRPEPYEPEEAEQSEQQPSTKEEQPANTYSRDVKYALIGVIIHEIGHNYFPMIVNSDERQWTWMDEGLNSFLEYVAELEWEENYPAYGDRVNVLDYISEYMVAENQVPVMTQSDAILQFGNNAYAKPTAALVVLRETVMGRELFDFAFKQYSQRWQFKRPTPADFFRTMEDASGIDLDWFWRGWFYSTDHVDLAIAGVREYQVATADPDQDNPRTREQDALDRPEPLAQIRNREAGTKTRVQRRPQLKDFYNDNDRFTVSNEDRNSYQEMLEDLEDWERAALDRAIKDKQYIYFVDFENLGGLVMPLPLHISYLDGSEELRMLPVQIWRRNHRQATSLLIVDKAVERFALDPRHETADADYANNDYPRKMQKSRLALYKEDDERRDLMADMLVSLREAKDAEMVDGKAVPLSPQHNDVTLPETDNGQKRK
ncbi:MAG: M1 family metallopeptidase [Pseudomonadales bacterium]